MSLVKAEEDLKKKGMLDRRSHGLGGCVQIKRIYTVLERKK